MAVERTKNWIIKRLDSERRRLEKNLADLTWKQLDIFNQRIYVQYREMPLGEVRAFFDDVHKEFMQMVEAMPDDEMLERGRYSFTGGSAIFDWLNAYAAHDMWGKKKIREWLRSKGEEI